MNRYRVRSNKGGGNEEISLLSFTPRVSAGSALFFKLKKKITRLNELVVRKQLIEFTKTVNSWGSTSWFRI